MNHYQTHAAAALEFLRRGIPLCRRVFTQVFIPDQEEAENGGTLSLHISWSVKTVALSASARHLHDWHLQLVSAVPKGINCLEKIIQVWMNFATLLRPMQESCGLGLPLRAPVQTPANSHAGTAALAWSSTRGKHGNRLREDPNTD